MWTLSKGTYRFSRLREELDGITPNTLTKQLREIEAANLVARKVYAEVPPRVEYELTQKAQSLRPVMEAMTDHVET